MTNPFDTLLAVAILGMALRLGWGIGTAVIDIVRDARAEQRERHE